MDVIELCHSEEIILEQEPFKGAADTCHALVEEGHELLYISNRATESEAATSDWLFNWDFPQHTNLVVTMESKTPYLAGCQYLIDDRPKTCIEFIHDLSWENDRLYSASNSYLRGDSILGEFLDTGYRGIDRFNSWHESKFKRRAFMLMYPYNHNLTDLPCLYLAPTWSGLNEYMVGKGVLSEPAHSALAVA